MKVEGGNTQQAHVQGNCVSYEFGLSQHWPIRIHSCDQRHILRDRRTNMAALLACWSTGMQWFRAASLWMCVSNCDCKPQKVCVQVLQAGSLPMFTKMVLTINRTSTFRDWMEFLDICLTKTRVFLLHAIHSHFYWRVFKKTILLIGFKNPYKNFFAIQQNSSLFMNSIL